MKSNFAPSLKSLRCVFVISTVVLLLLVSGVFAQDHSQQITDYLEQLRMEIGLPGISAAVSVNGTIVYSNGAGYADIENHVPASGKTVYRIASISKPIGALGLMQLLEQGKVKLDDPIQKYVPSFPEKIAPITVKHILTHTSGIRHYNPGEFGKMDHFETLKDAIVIFKDDPLKFKPGSKFGYSTYGFNLVQGVIESASGMPLYRYMKRYVWDPAGMLSTTFEYPGEIIYNRAHGYTRNDRGQIRNAPYTDVSIKYIGGGMISTVEDLVRLAYALGQDVLMKPETKALMYEHHFERGPNRYQGLGWGVAIDGKGRTIISHSGGATGFGSMLIFYPEEQLAVAVISNQDFFGVGNAASAIANIFLIHESDLQN